MVIDAMDPRDTPLVLDVGALALAPPASLMMPPLLEALLPPPPTTGMVLAARLIRGFGLYVADERLP